MTKPPKKAPKKAKKKAPKRGPKPRAGSTAARKIYFRVTDEEAAKIERAAAADLTPLSAWARRVVLAAADELLED